MPKWGEDGFYEEEEKETPNDESLDDPKDQATNAYQRAAEKNVDTINSYVKAYKEVKLILKKLENPEEKGKLDIFEVDTLLRFFKQDRSLKQLKRPKGMKEDDYVVNLVKPCINAIGKDYPSEKQLKNCFDIAQPATEDTSTTYRQIEAPLEKSQSIYQKIWDKLKSDPVRALWNDALLTSDVSNRDPEMVQRCRQFFDIIDGRKLNKVLPRDFDLKEALSRCGVALHAPPKVDLQENAEATVENKDKRQSRYKPIDDFINNRYLCLKAFTEIEKKLEALDAKLDSILHTIDKKETKQQKRITSYSGFYTSFVSTDDKTKKRTQLKMDTNELREMIEKNLKYIKYCINQIPHMLYKKDMNIEAFNIAAKILIEQGEKINALNLKDFDKYLSEISTNSTQGIIDSFKENTLPPLTKSLARMENLSRAQICLYIINGFLSKEISDARKEFAKGKFEVFTSRLLNLLKDATADQGEIKQMLEKMGEINKLISADPVNKENVISAIIRAGSISQITQISKFLNPSGTPVETDSHLQKLESIKKDLIDSRHNTDRRLHTMHEALDDVHSAVERAEKARSAQKPDGKLEVGEVHEALNDTRLQIPNQSKKSG